VTITIADALIILATLIGPIVAVQTQKWIERSREDRARKVNIFNTLMATRGVKAASGDHVKALNSIDIVFNRRNEKKKTIISAWEEYLDHLNNFPAIDDSAGQNTWNTRQTDLLAGLLKAIGDRLGYDFSSVQLKKGVYYPRGHQDEIMAGIALRKLVTEIANGQRALPLDIKTLPIDQGAFELQMEVQKATLAALLGKGAVTVSVRQEPPAIKR
jgi:hypothetical protein